MVKKLFFKTDSPRFIPILLVIIFALVLLKSNTLKAPFHWDVMGFLVPSAENICDHGVFIAKTGSTGHPPLFLAVLAVAWKIFGKTLLVSHALNILFGALGLTCLFFLAHRLYGTKTALTATLLLMFNQTFFTQVGIVYLSTPLMFTAVLTVHAYIKQSDWLFLLSATSMLLVKETSLVVLGSILLYEVIMSLGRKDKLAAICKRVSFLSLPIFPLAAWFLTHFLTVGYIFPPGRVFINQGGFVSLFSQNFMKHFIYDSSIENFNRANWLIFILLILYLVIFKKRKDRYESLFLIIVVLNLIFFTVTNDLPRYFLITFPFFLLAGARAAGFFAERTRFNGRIFLLPAIIILYIGLSVLNYHGTRNTDGWRLESNMEYLDMVRLHVKVCQFLQKEHAGVSILTHFPLNIALRKPWYGYVDKPLKVINQHALDETQDILIVWSAQSNFRPDGIFFRRKGRILEKTRNFDYRGKSVRVLLSHTSPVGERAP